MAKFFCVCRMNSDSALIAYFFTASYGRGSDRLPEYVAELLVYQTRQALALTIGWPALHENASWNSGMFCNTPWTR